ncbi:MAG: acyl--CoA ligase [Candidatus Omnitrophica bacterium]|nr:acyl--CoA ligase [Candidatus Omnitrophota bacterium]
MNVKEILLRNVEKFHSKPVLFFHNEAVNFLQIRDIVFKLAKTFKELGLKKGDKVAVYLPNIPAYIYSYLGIWCSGLVCVPLDFMLTEEEIMFFISHSEAKVLITTPKSGLSIDSLKEKSPNLRNIILCNSKEVPLKKKNLILWEEIMDRKDVEGPEVDIDGKDYSIIFYTSGTTGMPKGVLVNYLQLEAPPKALEYFVDINENDITLCALPFSHLGGLIYIQALLWFGLTLILMERFQPLEFLRNVSKYKVTCFWIVPSMYYAFLRLREFEELDLSSLRWIVSFGASSSPEALRRFHRYCPQAHFLNGWGLTETNAPTTVIKMGSNKIESVGRALPWVEVKIFDDNDKEVNMGEIGEIAVKGWVVSDGYYNNPQTTKEAFRNGWFYTGDLGRFDEEGDLYIVGRKKEMIKVSGEIVFEPEVEAVIMKNTKISEVAVIGVPDRLRGEVPKAFIVLKENEEMGEEEIRIFCRQHLAHFKVPHYFEFVKELPKTRSGKIDKAELRNRI